ncbi:hypothetical protein A3197_17255 [Candidatus Thiodiazotropha endoloripes]|nr:hypothetical protein A3197_17255 [Candidatus Thiodiazotropha endoloripes]
MEKVFKRIDVPAINDEDELTTLSENTRLSSFPELKNNLQIILDQIGNYHGSNGNPWSLTALDIPSRLKIALKSHYNKPPMDRLAYFKKFREELSPDVCPLCGGFGSSTLDHVLPKDDYPEFAVYSRNLVPACSCNNKKGTACKGSNASERVMHPYYDDFINEALYKSEFIGDFISPEISVVVINPAHPQLGVLEFHLHEVVLKNKIINWMIKTWGNLCTRGDKILDAYIPPENLDVGGVKVALEKYNHTKEAEYGTPNNWWSIFLFGLIDDNERLELLAEKLNNLRA